MLAGETLGKRCSVCAGIFAATAFTKRAASPDGLAHRCRDCNAQHAKAWRERNPGAFRRWALANKEALRANFKQWAAENSERRADYMAKWAKDNSALVNAKCARRMAAKVRATPSWADEAAIMKVYERAAALTEMTGVRHDVDHIYPLQSNRVCGLHCEANLQVLTKTENISKLNRMPEEWFARSREADLEPA